LAFTVTMMDQYASSDAQGLQAYTSMTAEHEDRVNVTLDAATEGTLTTRTNDTAGVITVEEHSFAAADIIDIYWADGTQLEATVSGTTATTITFSGGNGDVLPVATTEVTVFEPTEITQVVTKTKQQAMLMTVNGRCVVRTNSVTAPAETWEFEENDGFAWRTTGVHANPFSTNITAFWLSNGRAQETIFQFRNLRTE
jgi:hypothetical protein